MKVICNAYHESDLCGGEYLDGENVEICVEEVDGRISFHFTHDVTLKNDSTFSIRKENVRRVLQFLDIFTKTD